jgi:uncharacterized protein YqgV (UPF0045/DUF77 family)
LVVNELLLIEFQLVLIQMISLTYNVNNSDAGIYSISEYVQPCSSTINDTGTVTATKSMTTTIKILIYFLMNIINSTTNQARYVKNIIPPCFSLHQ